jgi:hypothetical protein
MNSIDFLEIIKKGWKITWSNKYLWWFGLFLALGGGASFNFPMGNNSSDQVLKSEGMIGNIFQQYWQIAIVIGIVLFLFILAVFVFRILSQAGIIKEIDKVEKNDQGNFKRGIAGGKKYFWKLILLEILVGFLVLAILVILGIPVAFLFFLKAYLFGFLSAFLAVVIFIPLVILISFSRKYAVFYLILADLGVKDSLEKGYCIFRKNILMSIVMSLIFIPIGIILFFTMIFLVLAITIIFFPMGLIAYFIFLKTGVIIVASLTILVFIICLIVLSAVYQVLYQASWYLFFKEIASIKKEEEAKETVREVAEKTLPNPESA